jgi:predicted RNA-binding Zn-ribbon protein involved in translation (DUF1610 family)
MKSYKIAFRKNPIYQKCPSCSSVNVIKRSRSRNGFEVFLKRVTFYKTYRCSNCGWRGYLSTFGITADTAKSLIFYILLALISGFIALELLRRIA